MCCGKQFGARCGKVAAKVAAHAGGQHEDSREQLEVMEQAYCMHRVRTWRYSKNTASGMGKTQLA